MQNKVFIVVINFFKKIKNNNDNFLYFSTFKEFEYSIFNNKSYFSKKKNTYSFLPLNYRNLFLEKIKENFLLLKLNSEDSKNLNLILEGKLINDVFLLWIYYCNFFVPIFVQNKKDVSILLNIKNSLHFSEKKEEIFTVEEKRYFSYNKSFLEKLNEKDDDFLLANKMGTFDFLLFKQAVCLNDYSYDYILGTHKILLDISTDVVVTESLDKYSRNDIRIRHQENSKNEYEYSKYEIRILIRKLIKQSVINTTDKKKIDDFFFHKIKKLNFRRQKLLEYYSSKNTVSNELKLYYNYINNLVFIIGKKIKILFLIRQIYFLGNFSSNFKYLIVLRKKLLFIIKSEKICRKKMLFLKKRKDRIKIQNIVEKEDFFFYKRRSNYLKFCNLMEKKKKGKYSNFMFSSLTDFSILIDVDGSKYFNSYLKHPFKNSIDEEIDLNEFFRDTSYNLNYMEYSDSTESTVLQYYNSKNVNVKNFLKGLNKYKFSTYNYAHPYKMNGDILEFEGLTRKIFKENRVTKKNNNLFFSSFNDIIKNIKSNSSNSFSNVFNINEYYFNEIPKNKTNFLTFSNKNFSLDQKTSMFFEFFLFGHIMFAFLGLNQKFNFHFCFNFLSKEFLKKDEYNSTLKNNTLVSSYTLRKNLLKTQYLLNFKHNLWLHIPLVKKFYYTYIVASFRFFFSGIIPSVLLKKNILFYIFCKLYLYFIDTTFAQFIFLVPISFIKTEIIDKILKKLFKLTNFPYSYSDFVRISYQFQCYLKIPGYSMRDLNNFITYYIASPYVYLYEKTIYYFLKYFFIIFEIILNLFN